MLMHAASRMIICSFFISRHFYGVAVFMTDSLSLGQNSRNESAPFFYDAV